jgi:hypothetical protein
MANIWENKEFGRKLRELEGRSEYDGRICFAIRLFDTEADADAYAELVKQAGITYNGGFYHGCNCGRDTSWDRKDESGKKIKFAVTC